MEVKPLVAKVKASGYMPKQTHKPLKIQAKKPRVRSLTSTSTMKGTSRAHVSRDGMPTSIEPIKSPRSKTLAQIGRSIKNV